MNRTGFMIERKPYRMIMGTKTRNSREHSHIRCEDGRCIEIKSKHGINAPKIIQAMGSNVGHKVGGNSKGGKKEYRKDSGKQQKSSRRKG